MHQISLVQLSIDYCLLIIQSWVRLVLQMIPLPLFLKEKKRADPLRRLAPLRQMFLCLPLLVQDQELLTSLCRRVICGRRRGVSRRVSSTAPALKGKVCTSSCTTRGPLKYAADVSSSRILEKTCGARTRAGRKETASNHLLRVRSGTS